MTTFEKLGTGYESVLFGHAPDVGLRTIIAVYSTARGPAIGGTRIWPFTSEDDALVDVLRLAKAMAYKAAAAGLQLGGGKAVIIADPATDKTPALLRAYAEQVNRLGGAYITTADVGSTVADLDEIAKTTRFVTGTSAGSGDPSPNTAFGVWSGMRAVAERTFGTPSLEGRHVVVQGVGKVGAGLARLLAREGARVTVSDVRRDEAEALGKEIGADVVEPEKAFATACDVLAPCALGPVVTDETLPSLDCRAIAGAANNQLLTPVHGRALHDAGIVYAPDYVINAGGLINVEDELHGYNPERARAKAGAIADTLREVFDVAGQQGIPPAEAADHIAEQRIAAAR
ncbi:MAG: Glu/Leu/Phe/Val dehydrogenase dimerization domain-containing protein [Actinomycetota bacterium]|nr:leucine dehydrogenase [Actinomycetota bacterium]